MGLILITAPATEPVTKTEAKLFAKIEDTADDDLVDSLIKAGRERCERVSGRALVTQTWKLTLDDWPEEGIIRLPKPPLQSITSITYVDPDGATQTLAASQYLVDATAEPGAIEEAWGVSWPSVREQAAAIAVTFVAGYGAAAAVPAEIKERLKNYVAYCHVHRSERDEAFLDRLFEGFFCGTYP